MLCIRVLLTLTAPKYFCITLETKGFFSILNHHKMSYFALSDSVEYLSYGSTDIMNIFTLTVRGPTLEVEITNVRF